MDKFFFFMDKFLWRYKLSTLTQEELENMYWSIISKEVKSVIKNLISKNRPGPFGSSGELYQVLLGKLAPILHRLFQKIGEKGTLPNSFYDTKAR